MGDNLPTFKCTNARTKWASLMEDLDTDHSGGIDYTEFLAASMKRRTHVQESVCWRAFRQFDLNGDGTISKEEFLKVLDNEHIHMVKDSKSPISTDMSID